LGLLNLLEIRGFTQDKDEEIWIGLLNQAFSDYHDRRPLTLDDMMNMEKSPNFDATGMLIAEFDGKPVGCVNAYVDKERREKKGFIQSLGVIPDFRRRGIGRELLKKAIGSLMERGMEYAEITIEENRVVCKKLVESMGFTPIRIFSMMAIDLTQSLSNIGENKRASMRTLNKDSLEDVGLFNRLHNEAFREHFNYRPFTLEETRFWVQQNPWLDISKYFLSYLRSELVGFVGVGIDTKYNEHRNKRRGWVMTIGVLKPHRLKGIGTALMLHGLQYLRSQGMDEAALWVDDENPTKAMKLYEKVGFQVTKKNLTYLKKLT
jgi:mycothiol synthase